MMLKVKVQTEMINICDKTSQFGQLLFGGIEVCHLYRMRLTAILFRVDQMAQLVEWLASVLVIWCHTHYTVLFWIQYCLEITYDIICCFYKTHIINCHANN